MQDYTTLAGLLALLLTVGAVAGLIAGLLGVGGGMVLVPAFFYTFQHLGYGGDHLMQVCVATSLATIVFTSLRSVRAHDQKGAVDWALLRAWAPFVVLGAALGVLVAAQAKSQTLQAIFGGVAAISGLYLAFGRPEWRLGDAQPDQPLRGIYAGFLGLFSTIMGIGGGTFGVPIMTLYGAPIHRAVGTSSGLGILVAVPSVIGFALMPVIGAPPFSLGAVNIPAFFAVVFATMITTPIGARLAHVLPAKPLKRAFALFVSIVALNMLRKAYGG